MDFNVKANFVVEYLDPDDISGRGIREQRGRVEGPIKGALDEADAVARTKRCISDRFPGRWKLRVGRVHVEAAN